MTSYPSQTAILQWLPFHARKRLIRRAPSLERVEARLPYNFRGLFIHHDAYSDVLQINFECMELSLFADSNGGQSVTNYTLAIEKNREVVRMCDAVLTGVTIDSVADEMMDLIFGRPGNRLGALVFHYAPLVERFRRGVNTPSVASVNTTSVMHAAFIPARLHWTVCFIGENVDFRRLVAAYTETPRSPGNVYIAFSKGNFIKLLSQIERELRHRNPIRALIPGQAKGGGSEMESTDSPDFELATLEQCLAIHLGHAFLIVHAPRRKYTKTCGECVYKMSVMPEEDVTTVGTPEDWLTVFETDGSRSYVDMS